MGLEWRMYIYNILLGRGGEGGSEGKGVIETPSNHVKPCPANGRPGTNVRITQWGLPLESPFLTFGMYLSSFSRDV
jgi:hypothetical protein